MRETPPPLAKNLNQFEYFLLKNWIQRDSPSFQYFFVGSPCFGEHFSGKRTFLLDKKRHFSAESLQIFTHVRPQERKYNGEGHASLGGPHHFGEKQCNGVMVSEVVVVLSNQDSSFIW